MMDCFQCHWFAPLFMTLSLAGNVFFCYKWYAKRYDKRRLRHAKRHGKSPLINSIVSGVAKMAGGKFVKDCDHVDSCHVQNDHDAQECLSSQPCDQPCQPCMKLNEVEEPCQPFQPCDEPCQLEYTGPKCPSESNKIVLMECAECEHPVNGCEECCRRLSPCECDQKPSRMQSPYNAVSPCKCKDPSTCTCTNICAVIDKYERPGRSPRQRRKTRNLQPQIKFYEDPELESEFGTDPNAPSRDVERRRECDTHTFPYQIAKRHRESRGNKRFQPYIRPSCPTEECTIAVSDIMELAQVTGEDIIDELRFERVGKDKEFFEMELQRKAAKMARELHKMKGVIC